MSGRQQDPRYGLDDILEGFGRFLEGMLGPILDPDDDARRADQSQPERSQPERSQPERPAAEPSGFTPYVGSVVRSSARLAELPVRTVVATYEAVRWGGAMETLSAVRLCDGFWRLTGRPEMFDDAELLRMGERAWQVVSLPQRS